MTQIVKYPLPPLFLTEIIEKCAADHAYREHPEDDEGLRKFRWENRCDKTPTIVEINEGTGRHVHDTCKRYPEGDCFSDCDDSDWIVTLEYSTKGYQAVYGVQRAGDVQDVSLWAD